MADNWEDRLASSPALAAPPPANWEDRLHAQATTAPLGNIDPTASDGYTLKVGPFDTGIPVGDNTFRFLAGAGKGMTDLARGVAQKLGGYSFSDAKDQAAQDAPLMQTSAGKWGDVAGTAAPTLAAGWIPGANSILGSAAIGAGLGAAQPATSFGDLAANTGLGAAAGAGGNLAGKVAGGVYGLAKSTVQPFFASGQRAIVDNVINAFEPQAQKAMSALNPSQIPIVPGSIPIAAEVAQTSGLAQLVKQVRQTPGTDAPQMFAERSASNAAAQEAALRSVAGDPAQRAALEATRDTTANQMYGAARAAGIDPAAMTPEAQANIAAFQTRMPQAALDRAREIAQLRGDPMTDMTSLSGMHWAKQGLDSMINGALSGGDNTDGAALTGLKSDMVAGMRNMSPLYGDAMDTFAANSRPLNQMDVGTAIFNKAVPALRDVGGNGNLRAQGLADALRHGDAVAQKALGMPTASISDVLDPAQLSTIQGVAGDLARSTNATNLARAAGSDTVQNAVSQNLLRNVIGPTGLPASMANNTLLTSMLRPAEFAAAQAQPKIMSRLAQTLLNPEETRQALIRAQTPSLASKAGGALLRYAGPSATAALPLSSIPSTASP